MDECDPDVIRMPTNTAACVVVTCRHVQYYAMIGGPSTLWDCGIPKSRDDDVVIEYSTNAGELICRNMSPMTDA